jgi:hypothetical protein
MTAIAGPVGASTTPRSPDRAWVRRLHVLVGVQSLVLVLASANRLSSVGDAAVLPHESLRVVELLNLLVLPPVSALAFYLLLEHLLGGVAPGVRRALRLAFLAALYLFAMSYGMHEPANYVHDRFCGGDGGQLCQVIDYHDDGLSHLLFFAGFAGIAAVLLIAQAVATGAAVTPLQGRDRALVLANASLIAGAIVANLGFEAIGLDLLVVALVAALSLALVVRAGPRPVIVYFAWAYVLGLLVTGAIKLA